MALLRKSSLSLIDGSSEGLEDEWGGAGPPLLAAVPIGLTLGLDLFERIGQDRLTCPSLLHRKHEFKPPRVSKMQVKDSSRSLISINLGMSTPELIEIKTLASRLGTRFVE